MLSILEKNLVLEKIVEYLALHGEFYWCGAIASTCALCGTGEVTSDLLDMLFLNYFHSFLGHSFFINLIFLHTPKLQQHFIHCCQNTSYYFFLKNNCT